MMLARLQTRNILRAVSRRNYTQIFKQRTPVCVASSSLIRSMSVQATKVKDGTVSSDSMNKFMSVWPTVKEDLIGFTRKDDVDPETTKRFAEALEYNVPHGKKSRGVLVVNTYQALAKNPSENDMKLACVMGWCVEMIQAMALIQDDIMDDSKTRRGKPSWYKVDGIGMFAFNDSMMIYTGLFVLLKKWFGDKDYYRQVFEVINGVTFYTCVGQSLDVTATGHSFTDFSLQTYESISKYKTFYYTFYLPMALGMHMAGKNNPEHLTKLQDVLLDISNLFQIQDDYIDVYGDPKITGKVGTDIQDKKCTWFPAMFNQKATPQQKEIFKATYGSPDPANVARVKQLFEEVGLVDAYKTYEENSVKKIKQKIEAYHELPSEVLLKIVGKLDGRKF